MTDASREWADQFHDATGWAMVVVAFVGLMALVRLMRWAGIPVDLASTDCSK